MESGLEISQGLCLTMKCVGQEALAIFFLLYLLANLRYVPL